MALFTKTDCDGRHSWLGPKRHTSALLGTTASFVECSSCETKTWGNSDAEAMQRAQEFDRAQREGRI